MGPSSVCVRPAVSPRWDGRGELAPESAGDSVCERESLVPADRLGMGLRTILRISSTFGCSGRPTALGRAGVLPSARASPFWSGFFQVEIIPPTWPDS